MANPPTNPSMAGKMPCGYNALPSSTPKAIIAKSKSSSMVDMSRGADGSAQERRITNRCSRYLA